MGFFSWLFGRKKQDEEMDEFSEKPVKKDDTVVEVKPAHPKHEEISRTPEVKEYVGSLLKKAENPDSKPESYRDTSDPKQAKEFVEKVQGKTPEEDPKEKKIL